MKSSCCVLILCIHFINIYFRQHNYIIRHQVAENIKKLYQQQNGSHTQNDIQTKKEDRIMKQIENKLSENKVMTSKADKGNSIVILYQDEYNQKVEEFISNNNFTAANTDITENLQREIRNTINDCQRVIQKSEK